MAQNRSAGILAVDLSLSLCLSLSSLSIFLFSVSMCNSHFQVIDSKLIGLPALCHVMASAPTDTDADRDAEVRRQELKKLLADKRSLINGLLKPNPLKLAALPSIPAPQTQHNPAAWCLFKQKQKVKQKRTPLTLKHAVFQGQQAVLQLTWACRQAACLQKKVKHKRTLLTIKASLHHPDWSDLNKSKSCSCMSSPCPPKRG